MGAVRMRVNGCSAVNGCRQNEREMDFFTGGSVIMDLYFSQKKPFEVKNVLMLD